MELESTIKGLPIDLHDIELVKADDIIKGKGTLSLNSYGLIELKIFPDNPKDFTIETLFKSYNQSIADAGKLLSEEAYYSFKGTAVNNDQYICKRLLITDRHNLRVYTIKLCSDLIITNDPKLDSFQTARVQIPYKIKLPTNHGFEVEKKYGLKKWHLSKFCKSVDRFYQDNIDKEPSSCELVAKYQKRFQRYRDSLFTFLQLDGIPWHNNTAENAIRHLAVQRKISGTFFKKVAPQYLLLLGIAQTCRFQDKSLLKFFLSEEIDIDKFKAAKHIKTTSIIGRPKDIGVDDPTCPQSVA